MTNLYRICLCEHHIFQSLHLNALLSVEFSSQKYAVKFDVALTISIHYFFTQSCLPLAQPVMGSTPVFGIKLQA